MRPASTTGWPTLAARLHSLVATPLSAILTVFCVGALLLVVPPALDWFWWDARFVADSAVVCRQDGGACWAVIADKYRLVLFGLYPLDEQWRPLMASLLLVALVVVSCLRSFWRPWLFVIWMVVLLLVAGLMWGGVAGLVYVENRLWGGLPLTLLLATLGIGLAFPLGVLLALGRRSDMPAVRAFCVVYIELIRGVPLISLLFLASVMLPLFLPAGVTIDKLARVLIAMVCFVAAYIAETVRGGLQSVPLGQYQGADALGLSYWQKMRHVILPQALGTVIGPLTGIFISLFKDTSLVVVVGIFDLTQAAKTALADARWQGFSTEVYLFIGAIYFIFCWAMSRYSQSLEGRRPVG